MLQKRGADHYKLTHSIIKEIDELLPRIGTDGTSSVKDQFYDILRRFMKEFFKIDYEFTSKEVESDIMESGLLPQEQKDSLVSLISFFEEREYSPEEFSETDLRNMIQQFRSIIVSMMEESFEEELQETPLVDRILFRLLHLGHRIWLRGVPQHLQEPCQYYARASEHLFEGEIGLVNEMYDKLTQYEDPALKKLQEKLKRKLREAETDDLHKELHEGLERLHLLLKKEKLDAAKEQYKEITEVYEKLPGQRKKGAYKDLDHFYKRIARLESAVQQKETEQLIEKARTAYQNNNQEIADQYFEEIEEKFRHLHKREQKKLKKKLDNLSLELYASHRAG